MSFTKDAHKLANYFDKDILNDVDSVSNPYEAADLYVRGSSVNHILNMMGYYDFSNYGSDFDKILNTNEMFKSGVMLYNERFDSFCSTMMLQKDCFMKMIDDYVFGLFQFKDEFIKKDLSDNTISISCAISLLRNYYSEYDLEGLRIFDNLFNADRIIVSNFVSDAGIALYDESLYNCFILLKMKHNKKISIKELICLVHEIDHIKYRITQCCNVNEEIKFNRLNFNGFREVDTLIVEKKFINYLIKNTDFKEEAISYLMFYNFNICLIGDAIKKDYFNTISLWFQFYGSFVADWLLDKHDFDDALNCSYELLNKGFFPAFGMEFDGDSVKKILKRQYNKIVE